jgi:signal transduction histidine kinase
MTILLLRYLYLLLLSFLLSTSLLSAEMDTLYVDKAFTEVALGKYIRYLSDSSNSMQVEDFIEATAPTIATLNANKRNEVNIGYAQTQHWLRWHVVNRDSIPVKLFLSLAYPNLDHILLYQVSKVHGVDSVKQIAEMGDNFRNGNKLVRHRNYVIPVYLAANSTQVYILQIKNQWEPLNFPIYLSNEYYLIRRTNNDNLFLGAYFGMHFTFALLILTLFIFTRNIFFFIYLCLVVLSIINIISDTGLGLEYIWMNVPFIQKLLPYFISFGTIILHITFIRLFFSTALHFERFNQIFLILISLILLTLAGVFGFALAFPASNLPYQVSYGVINTLYISYGIVILSLSVIAFYQIRRKEILWVLIAVFIHFTSWTIHIFLGGNAFPLVLKNVSIYDYNLFPSYISTPHLDILLILLEIIVVSIILGLNFYSFIKDNSTSQYKLLLLQRKTINAYIEGQERERSKLADKISEGIMEDIRLLKIQMSDFMQKLKDPVTRSKLNKLIDEVDKIRDDVSVITAGFVSSQYINRSFNDAVKSIFSSLKANNIQVRYQLAEPSPAMSDFSKVNICRILQECAGNIAKHSNATEVEISISYHQKLNIRISDNGKGFDNETGKNAGIGLMNISSRIKGMNGILKIDSSPGRGTTLHITLPLNELKS